MGELEETSNNVEGRLEVAKRYHVAPPERMQLQEKPLVSPQVGI